MKKKKQVEGDRRRRREKAQGRKGFVFIALRLRTSAVRGALRAPPVDVRHQDARRGCFHVVLLPVVSGEGRVESSSAGQGHPAPAYPRGGSKGGAGIALLCGIPFL